MLQAVFLKATEICRIQEFTVPIAPVPLSFSLFFLQIVNFIHWNTNKNYSQNINSNIFQKNTNILFADSISRTLKQNLHILEVYFFVILNNELSKVFLGGTWAVLSTAQVISHALGTFKELRGAKMKPRLCRVGCCICLHP